jgi:hypothetical protein
LYIDLGSEREMRRTAIGDAWNIIALMVGKIADRLQASFESIHPTFTSLAAFAVFGVNLVVFQAHRHAREAQFFACGIHTHGHRRAGAERRQA